jgi:hypothetical protein
MARAGVAFLVISVLSIQALAGFDEGMSAAKQGDYATALKELSLTRIRFGRIGDAGRRSSAGR